MVSNVLCDLAAGDLVDLSAPTGGFRLPEGDAPLVFITAGIGAAMLRSVDEHRSVTFKRTGRPLGTARPSFIRPLPRGVPIVTV